MTTAIAPTQKQNDEKSQQPRPRPEKQVENNTVVSGRFRIAATQEGLSEDRFLLMDKSSSVCVGL